jgi:hypothetical protein
MSNREQYRDLLDHLIHNGLTEYGAVIPKEEIYDFLGIEVPKLGTLTQFNQIALLELAAIDYCRSVLLNEGKYITQDGGVYRILLPHENARQVEIYISSADRKLTRALKLSRNTPRQASGDVSQTQARIMMRQHGLESRRMEAQL